MAAAASRGRLQSLFLHKNTRRIKNLTRRQYFTRKMAARRRCISFFGRGFSTGKQNLYETLGIEPDASQNEIRKAFLQMSKKYHPDVSGANTEDQFSRISSAYKILSDPVQRKQYDDMLNFGDIEEDEHDTILKQGFQHGMGFKFVNYKLDYANSRLVNEHGEFIPITKFLAFLLLNLGVEQAGPKQKHSRPAFHYVGAGLLLVLLVAQAYETYRDWRYLDPCLVPLNVLERRRSPSREDETKGLGFFMRRAHELVEEGKMKEAVEYFQIARTINSLPGLEALILETMRSTAVLGRQIDLQDHRTKFRDPKYFIQPEELNDRAMRIRFQGGLLGSTAWLSYIGFLLIRRPHMASMHMDRLALFSTINLWGATVISSALLPRLLPYPSSTMWDSLHGNTSLIYRGLGMLSGMGVVAMRVGIRYTTAPALFFGGLFGRFSGHMATKFVTGRYFSSSRELSDFDIQKERESMPIEQLFKAEQQLTGISSNNVSHTKPEGKNDKTTDDWEQRMKEKAKRLKNSGSADNG